MPWRLCAVTRQPVSAGHASSPFNAWTLLKGMETLKLRVMAQCEAALTVARFLETQPAVSRVIYPFLDSHPQHELCKRQMVAGGTMVTDELARACGMDAGFGRGATGHDVASFLVRRLRAMAGE